MRLTLKRFKAEAKISGFFDHIHIFTERDLPDDLRSYCNSNPRGYGYYIWKPYFTMKVLSEISTGDVLIWVDGGSSIYPSGHQKFMYYVEKCKASQYKNLGFEGWSEHYETKYTKKAVFSVLDANDFYSKESFGENLSLMAGCFFIEKCKFTTDIVSLWFVTCRDFRFTLDDSPDEDGVVKWDHRHDQSVWSVIRRKHGCEIIPHPDRTWVRHSNLTWFSEIDEPKIPAYGSLNWYLRRRKMKIPIILSRYRLTGWRGALRYYITFIFLKVLGS